MNNLFKILDIFSSVRFKSVDVNAMSTVKGGAFWVNVIIRLLRPLGLSVTGPRVNAIVVIFKRFAKIGQQQGIRGLVIHLKACHVCLTQALAGHMIKDTGALGARISRTNKGLPRIILSIDRARVRGSEPGIVKFYQTVFGLYRILSFEGKLKTASITAPFSGNSAFITNTLLPLVPHFVRALPLHKVFPTWEGGVTWVGLQKVITPGRPAVLEFLREQYRVLNPIWLAKSASGTHRDGIQVSSHPFLMIRTVRSIMDSSVYNDFKAFFVLFPVNHLFVTSFEAAEKVAHYCKPLFTLGKIGVKEEAAGKVRLFAMVPSWFQILLEPIHSMIFKILRFIHQDGTFNQMGPLRDHTKYSSAFSLDLTAATDRLPLSIQVAILGELIGPDLAKAWGRLLTEIDYLLSNTFYGVREVLKYSVGQPMGALSSWAMLALTHHFLVQVAAWLSGVTPVGVWFKDYAILGDDLVIFNRVVADKYRWIISQIGMEIGLHKSVLSRKRSVLEFAKRIFMDGHDVSAIPLKEFFASLSGYGDLIQFARKYNLGTLDLARMLGFKYRALSKVNHGFTAMPAAIKRIAVAMALPTTADEVLPYLELGKPKVSPWPVSLDKFFSEFTQTEFRNLLNTISKRYNAVLGDPNLLVHLLPDLKNDPLLHSIISQKYCVPVYPFDMLNWVERESHPAPIGGGAAEPWVIPGPAEAKEYGLGFTFTVQPGNPVFQPKDVRGFRPHSPDNLRAISKAMLTDGMVREFRVALSFLVDFQIIPKRLAVLEANRAVQSLIAQRWLLPEDIAQVFVSFLEVSREAALVRSTPVSFIREESPERSKDPVSLRMWRRWSKLIQGTVFRRTLGKG